MDRAGRTAAMAALSYVEKVRTQFLSLRQPDRGRVFSGPTRWLFRPGSIGPGASDRLSPPAKGACGFSLLAFLSKPEDVAAQVKVVAQVFGRSLVDHAAALQGHRSIRQRQRQIEMVIDDDDSDLPPQP